MKHVRLCAGLLAGLAVAGCRGTGPQPDAASGRGMVRIDSLPQAEVVIDGEDAGNTPLVRDFPEGSHDIVLRAGGFRDHEESIRVVAGGIADVDRVLIAEDPGDPVAIAKLAAGLEIGELTAFEPRVRHRGAPDPEFVAPLYPRGNVRLRDLTEYRVDVGEAFRDEGRLVFRRRSQVLFATKFDPAGPSTVAPVPKKVVSALKSGAIVTWGFYPANGKPVTARFRVVRDDERIAKRLRRMEERMAGHPEVALAEMRAQLFLNKKLYTAAYLEARRALELAAGDEAPPTQALAVMQGAAQRMELRGTPLWQEIEDEIERVPARVRRRHTRVR
jgi:hypothetical protein